MKRATNTVKQSSLFPSTSLRPWAAGTGAAAVLGVIFGLAAPLQPIAGYALVISIITTLISSIVALRVAWLRNLGLTIAVFSVVLLSASLVALLLVSREPAIPDEPLPTLSVEALGPRATLTAKGYSIYPSDLAFALATQQYEDVELFLEAGIRLPVIATELLDLPFDRFQAYDQKGILDANACRFDISDEQLNIELLEYLETTGKPNYLTAVCGGAYYNTILALYDQFSEKETAIYSRNESLIQTYQSFLPQCTAELRSIFSISNVRNMHACQRGNEPPCDPALNVQTHGAIQALVASGEALGLHGRIRFDHGRRENIPSLYGNVIDGFTTPAYFNIYLDEMAEYHCTTFEPFHSEEVVAYELYGEKEYFDLFGRVAGLK